MIKKKNYLVFITDPLEQFHPERESTLFMMKEAQDRSYGIFCATLPNLSLQSFPKQEVLAQGSELEILGIGRRPFYKIKRNLTLKLSEATAIFLRKDPPFDLGYLHHLYLLSQLRGRVYMMNDPLGILALSEKIFPLWFEKYCPATLITRSADEAFRFAREWKSGVVLKPLNSSGGRGVFKLKAGDSNFQVAFDSLSQEGQTYVICQQFLPKVSQGDKRVMLVGGEILGYFARIPAKASHRANLHSGGRLKKCGLTGSEREMSEHLGQVLLQWGIDFAGIDLIGGKLTEVNVTSPMGLREINVTQGLRSEKRWMDFVERRIGKNNASAT